MFIEDSSMKHKPCNFTIKCSTIKSLFKLHSLNLNWNRSKLPTVLIRHLYDDEVKKQTVCGFQFWESLPVWPLPLDDLDVFTISKSTWSLVGVIYSDIYGKTVTLRKGFAFTVLLLPSKSYKISLSVLTAPLYHCHEWDK